VSERIQPRGAWTRTRTYPRFLNGTSIPFWLRYDSQAWEFLHYFGSRGCWTKKSHIMPLALISLVV
jgi:hypothetical protein